MITLDRRALLLAIIAEIRDNAELQRELSAALASDVSGPRLVSVSTFAREREVGQSTVRRAIAEGRLEHVRIGRSVRIPSSAAITSGRRPSDSPKTRADRAWKRIAGGRR